LEAEYAAAPGPGAGTFLQEVSLLHKDRRNELRNVLAGFFAVALHPAVTWLERKVGFVKRWLATLIIYVLAVLFIGITFLVLAMAFRSLVIAIKAALTTLTSAVVGFSALTVVVQLGHGMGLIGLDRTGPIESFVPPIAFAILFGLSMDYEVFLLSRMKEEFVRTGDNATAVADGLAAMTLTT